MNADTSDEPRPLEACSYRITEDAAGGVRCGLLEALLDECSEDSMVQEETCRACSALPEPSESFLNAQVASRLFEVTERHLQDGPDRAASVERLEALHRWALRSLMETPTVSPDGPSDTVPPCSAITKFLPRPPKRWGSRIERWAVGVTTSWRYPSTLATCLDSLSKAGFDDPVLFVDGEMPIDGCLAKESITRRIPRVGAWPNYYLAVLELLMREPHADAYMLVQDDAVFCTSVNMREYLEEILWPEPRIAAISLYCSTKDEQPEPGWYVFGGQWTWGAVALIFSRESAKAFVTDPQVLSHRWSNRNDGCANIDTEVGLWAQDTRRSVCFPTPSLVQHIGDTSTLWHGATATGSRYASSYPDGRDCP